MRQLKASDFATAYEFEAYKRQARKESRTNRDSRKAGRGRTFEANKADE